VKILVVLVLALMLFEMVIVMTIVVLFEITLLMEMMAYELFDRMVVVLVIKYLAIVVVNDQKSVLVVNQMLLEVFWGIKVKHCHFCFRCSILSSLALQFQVLIIAVFEYLGLHHFELV
jgi:hypothetical protein